MTRRLLLLTAALLALALVLRPSAVTESPQGFAGLGAEAEGYAEAGPGQPLRFPDDHGPHPDYRIEWWYLTANLADEQGQPLGIQWTLFRQALAPPDASPVEPTRPWHSRQLWMAHAAVSRGERHLVEERFARGLTLPDAEARRAQAGAVAEPFAAWLDDWRLNSRVVDPAGDTFEQLEVSASGEDAGQPFGYRLTLTAEGPLVLHGEAGFSQKSADGQGSYYYSQPFWRVEGEVELDGETHRVSGRGWLDREWSSQLLGPTQQGWDWFSLHLDDGHRLMAFRLRGGGRDGDDYLSGSWIAPDGSLTPLSGDDLALIPQQTSSAAGREVPTRWRLQLPGQGLDLAVTARHPERWMETAFAYWEGEVVAVDHDSGERQGEGYLEMTGY
nr:lipocalin-like domain-containing protein [Halomonas socia]